MVRTLIFEGSLAVLACVLGWFLDTPPFERVQCCWQAIVNGVLATGPPILAFWWCIRSQWSPLRRLLLELEDNVLPSFASCSLFDLALVSALAGLAEEALFRGVVQESLSARFNPWVGLLLASLLFGLLHFITPTYALLAGLISLYLGWLFLAYENLLLPMIVHALYDFVALTHLVRKKERSLGPEQSRSEV